MSVRKSVFGEAEYNFWPWFAASLVCFCNKDEKRVHKWYQSKRANIFGFTVNSVEVCS